MRLFLHWKSTRSCWCSAHSAECCLSVCFCLESNFVGFVTSKCGGGFLGCFGASLPSFSSSLVVASGVGLFSLSHAGIACCSSSHWAFDIGIHDHPISSAPGGMRGRCFRLVLMTFLSFLTSAWVEWELTMCWDGLVSKLSQLSAAVAFMLVGALVEAVDDCVTLAVAGGSCSWCCG